MRTPFGLLICEQTVTFFSALPVHDMAGFDVEAATARCSTTLLSIQDTVLKLVDAVQKMH